MPEEKIKVVLIEDSGLMRLIISDILGSDKDIELVDTAENGNEGLEKVKKCKPHVVITDLVMPQFDGVYAVKQIMQQVPTPVIVLSSLGKADQLVFDALYEGAVDFVDKPKVKVVTGIREVNQQLIQAVKAARRANIFSAGLHKTNNTYTHNFKEKQHYGIICIGASTGGPGAIEKIIEKLPGNLAIPVVIAQHMPERFLESFAKRLNNICPLYVKMAEKGEILNSNTIYIAPGHSNTLLINDILTNKPAFTFTKREYREFNFPSVDCLMVSAAQVYRNKVIGVILTGMGKDGTEGMKAIFAAGGYTIAQDEDTSVVYGMPKSVADSGVAIKSVSLQDIPSFIISCL